MSLVVPSWVAHISTDDADSDKDKKKPTTIFSLNVHPDGSRLATGGIDQKIRIWATEPILDSKVENLPGAHRLLSTLSRHSGSVVSLRFSPSGKYLASGSDDTVCLIWEFDPSGTGGGSFGSFGSSEQNVESWRVHRRLTGHESDVVDIAWSADSEDSYLATVGLDATVNIWGGAALNFERIKTIRAHDGFVKGVVWDPRGQYLATQSDDKTLKIWRTSDWSCAKVIQEPFTNSPTSNFFGRLSWSPDGAHIVAANAMNGPVFISSVIARDTWDSDLKLVGHEDSVVVTAFSPRLFRHLNDPPQAAPATIVALGSRDQSVSIWITGNTRPVIVLKDVFERQVTDLSWSSDGLTLYASSTAGAVAVLTLDKKLFKEVLPRDAVTFTRPQVGRDAGYLLPLGGSAASGSGTSQRPNILQPRKAGAARSAAPSLPPPPAAATSGGIPRPANARAGGERLTQQIEILANGKRRIRPTLVGGDDAGQHSASAMDVDPPSSYSQPIQQVQHSAPAQPGISTSQLLEVLSQLPAFSQPAQTQTPARNRPSASTLSITELPAIVSALKDLAGPSTTYSGTHQSFEAALSVVRQQKGKGREGKVVGQDVPVPSGSGSAGAGALVRVSDAVETTTRTHALETPSILPTLRRQGEGGYVEVANFPTDSDRAVEVRVYDDGDRLQFMDFVSSQVLRCTLSLGYVAIALVDGTIQVYTNKGRLLCTLSLDSAVCFLESKGSILLAITSSGNVHRWNLQDDVELHRPISCLSLLKTLDDVQQVYLHSNGAPILILRSTESAWTIDSRKNTWTCIADGFLSQGSEVWDGRARGRGIEDSTTHEGDDEFTITAISSESGRWREPVKTIESEINSLLVSTSSTRKRKRPPVDDEKRSSEFRLTCTLRHMELRLQAAVLLSSKDEYVSYLKAYARKLAAENLKGVGEDLVRDLLGPIYHSDKERSSWEPTLFEGQLVKRNLVKDVLGIFKKSSGRLEGMAVTYLELVRSMGL